MSHTLNVKCEIRLIDKDDYTLDFGILKYKDQKDYRFNFIIPICERDEFVIPIGTEKDLAQSLRQMADLLEGKI